MHRFSKKKGIQNLREGGSERARERARERECERDARELVEILKTKLYRDVCCTRTRALTFFSPASLRDGRHHVVVHIKNKKNKKNNALEEKASR